MTYCKPCWAFYWLIFSFLTFFFYEYTLTEQIESEIKLNSSSALLLLLNWDNEVEFHKNILSFVLDEFLCIQHSQRKRDKKLWLKFAIKLSIFHKDVK